MPRNLFALWPKNVAAAYEEIRSGQFNAVVPANFGPKIEYDPNAGGATSFGKASYTIVDYSVDPATRGSWSTDVEAGSPKFVSAAEGYSVPLAGCEQADCGYQHAIYTLPEDVVAANVLSKCENLMVTMKGKGGAVSYVNIGVNDATPALLYGLGNPEVGRYLFNFPRKIAFRVGFPTLFALLHTN